MQHKTYPLAEVKSDGDGQFTALASVFGNVDAVGDRVLPGAFEKTLERWRSSGDPLPVILSHQWEDPMAMIGKADPHDVVESERGLVVHGQLDLENATARQVHKLMRDRLLKGWSFGYTVPEGGQKRGKDANEINEIDLIEVGPTLVGANPEAQLQTVKASLEHPSPLEAAAQLKALATAVAGDSAPPPLRLYAQLRSIAAALEEGVPPADETSTSATTDSSRTEPGEEPDGAKPPRQAHPLERQVQRAVLENERHR